jgi:hypothetical protein
VTGRLWQAQLSLALDRPPTDALLAELLAGLDTFSPAAGYSPTVPGEILVSLAVVDAPTAMTALSMAYCAAGSVLTQHGHRIIACSEISVRDQTKEGQPHAQRVQRVP